MKPQKRCHRHYITLFGFWEILKMARMERKPADFISTKSQVRVTLRPKTNNCTETVSSKNLHRGNKAQNPSSWIVSSLRTQNADERSWENEKLGSGGWCSLMEKLQYLEAKSVYFIKWAGRQGYCIQINRATVLVYTGKQEGRFS